MSIVDSPHGDAARIAAAIALVERAICLVESAGGKGSLIACHLQMAVDVARPGAGQGTPTDPREGGANFPATNRKLFPPR